MPRICDEPSCDVTTALYEKIPLLLQFGVVIPSKIDFTSFVERIAKVHWDTSGLGDKSKVLLVFPMVRRFFDGGIEGEWSATRFPELLVAGGPGHSWSFDSNSAPARDASRDRTWVNFLELRLKLSTGL
eukprot:835244-Amorphochlora_amoeboformis.AAC.1